LWRLDLGKSGNKGKKYSAIFGYLVLSVLVMVGFVYVLAIQPNVLWLEFIIFIIALVIAGIGSFCLIFRVLDHDCLSDMLQSQLSLMNEFSLLISFFTKS
jgi:hypothetical protein